MYKNKVLGLLSWACLCPALGEEAKEGFASLPLSLTAHCSPFLPSGDTTEETVEQNHAEAFTVLLQFSKLPSKPADCISPNPNGTQHPAPSTAQCWLLGRLSLGPGPFPPPIPQDTM